MAKPTEYEWIRRWGRAAGSYDYYIVEQQKQAAADGAPLDATFWREVDQYKRDMTALGRDPATIDQEGEILAGGKRIWFRVRDIESVMTLSRFLNMYPETRDELEPLIIKLSEPLSEEAEAELS